MRDKVISYKYTNDLRVIFSVMITVMLVSCNNMASNVNDHKEPIVLDSALMLPEFTMYLYSDSSAYTSASISKEGLILVKYFSPDCKHCQDEAELYFSKKDSLSNFRTLWVTGDWSSLNQVTAFVEQYKIEQFKTIAIGKEMSNDLLAHYKLSGIPFAAVYRDNQLIKEYRGEVDFSELIKMNNGKL